MHLAELAAVRLIDDETDAPARDLCERRGVDMAGLLVDVGELLDGGHDHGVVGLAALELVEEIDGGRRAADALAVARKGIVLARRLLVERTAVDDEDDLVGKA